MDTNGLRPVWLLLPMRAAWLWSCTTVLRASRAMPSSTAVRVPTRIHRLLRLLVRLWLLLLLVVVLAAVELSIGCCPPSKSVAAAPPEPAAADVVVVSAMVKC